METKHADLPWETDTDRPKADDTYAINDADGCIVALVLPAFAHGESIQQGNAAFIVRACNAHRVLVSELSALADFMESAGFDATAARAALTKALT